MRESGFWVFAYGSLMWDPGFSFEKALPARLHGYHRRFSVYSNGSWGNPANPGLALALHPGGSCLGRAFKIAAAGVPKILDALDRRESAYARRQVVVTLAGQTPQKAFTYVHNPAHPRATGRLPASSVHRLIRSGSGDKGSSLEYLQNTVQWLDAQGVRSGAMHRLLATVIDGGGGSCGGQPKRPL